jgi:polar amino acid transport system substrate-binding protein
MNKWVLSVLSAFLLLSVFTGCNSKPVITSFADAKYASIGVTTGTTGETIALTKFPEAKIKSFNDIMDAIAALKAGQLDAVITSSLTAHQVVKKNPEFYYLQEPLQYEDTSIAVKKGDDELLLAVDNIIGELQADGTLADMRKRWFKMDLSPYVERKIEVSTKGKVLNIGVSAYREPVNFVDKDGRVTGFDGELARIIGARLHRPIEFYNMKFMALIPALQSGRVDLIITSMTATKERKKSVNFTRPYCINSEVMIVKKAGDKQDVLPPAPAKSIAGSNKPITTLQEIDGKRIGVLSGSAGDMAARKHFPHSSFQVMINSADIALAVKNGKTDAFVYDKSVLQNMVEKNPDLVILDEPVDKLEVAAAIKKENSALLSMINSALLSLKKEGALDRLRKKWVDSKYAATPLLPMINRHPKNGVLKMGTCANLEPFSFQSNGKLTGMDVELSQLIGKRLGKEIKIIDMNFEALIPALQSGKIDFALSNFNVTEERKKLVLFSLPYIENDISALVRRFLAAKPDNRDGLRDKRSETLKTPKAKISSPADLKDKRIGVLLGSVHDAYAIKTYPQATILQYKTPSDIVLAVKTGKVDAAIYTYETLLNIFPTNDDLGMLEPPLFSVPVGMGFNKQNNTLPKKFNEFLIEIKKNGIYDDMERRWITKGETTMPPIQNTKTNGILTVGVVSDKGLPFAILKNNKLIGYDIELSERFAAYLGKEVKFSDMEFGSLIAAVSTNKIDMISSTLMITEERKKQIGFSDEYYDLRASAFALKKNIVTQGNKATEKDLAAPSFIQGLVNSVQSNIVQENRWQLILDGLRVTVIISLFSTLFGTVLGALVCFMRMSSNRLLKLLASLYIAVLRGTPVLVFLMLIFYVVFASVNIDPVFVAVIAFGMNFAAYVAEIFRSGIESIDKGQTEAGIAMGFTRLNTFLFIVLPQTLLRILPTYKGEFISLVKMTSIVGYIAVQDLTKASDIIRSRTFDAFFPLIMVAVLYFLISWVLMQSIEYVERVTDPKFKRKQRKSC